MSTQAKSFTESQQNTVFSAVSRKCVVARVRRLLKQVAVYLSTHPFKTDWSLFTSSGLRTVRWRLRLFQYSLNRNGLNHFLINDPRPCVKSTLKPIKTSTKRRRMWGLVAMCSVISGSRCLTDREFKDHRVNNVRNNNLCTMNCACAY